MPEQQEVPEAKSARRELVRKLMVETMMEALPHRGSSLEKGKIRKSDVYFTPEDLRDFSNRLDQAGIDHTYNPAEGFVLFAEEEDGSPGHLFYSI